MKTSARNQFAGTVGRIRRGAVNDEIEIQLRGGERLFAVVTRESTRQLGLRRGAPVVAWIKASWVMVAVADAAPMKLSARNQLSGTIARLTRGAVNTDVMIQLTGDNTVAANITNVSARALKLKRGMAATAVFKASSVILAVAG